MSVVKTISLSVLAGVLAAPAFAQTTVYEPVPEDLSQVVRAQYIKPGDVSPEEYAKLLEEAERVRAFQSSSGSSVTTTYSATPHSQPQTTTTTSAPVYSSAPTYATSSTYTSPSVTMYNTPRATTYASTASTPSSAAVPITRSNHKVQKGDTLYNISKRYGVTLQSLKSANGISDSSIQLGQLLTIPGTMTSRIMETITPQRTTTLVRNVEPVPSLNVYAVLPGDTLYGISRRACLKVSDLTAANGIASSSTLQPGQRLTLPAGHCLK